jgi:hypothetical protein
MPLESRCCRQDHLSLPCLVTTSVLTHFRRFLYKYTKAIFPMTLLRGLLLLQRRQQVILMIPE